MPDEPLFSIADERDRFKRQYKHIEKNHKPFGEQVIELLEKDNLDTGKAFSDITLLNTNILSRLKNDPYGKFEFQTVVAICVGLNLDLQKSEQLLASAGLAFKPLDKIHQAYKYILANMPDTDIDTRNEFLSSLSVEPLGSKMYRK